MIDWPKWRARIVHFSRTACLRMKVCEYPAAKNPLVTQRALFACVCLLAYLSTLFPLYTYIDFVFMCMLRLLHLRMHVTIDLINNRLHDETDPQRVARSPLPLPQPPAMHVAAVIEVVGCGWRTKARLSREKCACCTVLTRQHDVNGAAS